MKSQQNTNVVIVGRKKGSSLWKPMPQIKVSSFDEAIAKVSQRSNAVDQGLELGVKVITLYTDIERIPKVAEAAP